MNAGDLFEALAVKHLAEPGVERRRMFGSDGLTVNDRFFAFLNRDRLVVKLPEATAAAMIKAGEGVVATTVSPTMKRWTLVAPPTTPADSHRWRQLMTDTHAYACRCNEEDPGDRFHRLHDRSCARILR